MGLVGVGPALLRPPGDQVRAAASPGPEPSASFLSASRSEMINGGKRKELPPREGGKCQGTQMLLGGTGC